VEYVESWRVKVNVGAKDFSVHNYCIGVVPRVTSYY
jgi:hypothetical protein